MSEIKKEEAKKFKLEHWQIIAGFLIIYDVVAVNAAYFLALLLRFDFRFSLIDRFFLERLIRFSPIYTILCVAIFYLLKLYKSIWRFASFDELIKISVSSVLTSVLYVIITLLIGYRMPISVYIIGAVFQFVLITVVRFSYRLISLTRLIREANNNKTKRTMIIGAGEAGRAVIRDLKSSNESAYLPVCIIDDNPNKWGRTIDGVKVVGSREDILSAVEKYDVDSIMLAIPTLSPEDRKEILNICKETDCELKSLPGLYQLASGDVSVSKMKPVQIEDLLGRETIKVNNTEVFEALKDKVILVTGGGGSIGSELCRQIAAHNPKQLIIFDIYENNAYSIEQELKRKYGTNLNLVVLIGSVRDTKRVNKVFETYKPEIVYHAAAHKHVPLMETSPNEAIKNNVIGTYKVALAAMLNKAERFVLISTDKAVNPTNIMGASKRLCEMVIQTMDYISINNKVSLLPQIGTHNKETNISIDKPITRYVAVRFGNVLGSNGSVIPLFKKQIEDGGPVTVTHPDIIRYFMTIPEAVSLVLQSGCYANGGEIFVLDMGEPVKIVSLARNLIKLSGYKPDVDIKIEYTGLRPGEKLYEEKLMSEEGLEKTDNDLIHIGKPIDFDKEEFINNLKELNNKSKDNDDNIVSYVEEILPTFRHKA